MEEKPNLTVNAQEILAPSDSSLEPAMATQPIQAADSLDAVEVAPSPGVMQGQIQPQATQPVKPQRRGIFGQNRFIGKVTIISAVVLLIVTGLAAGTLIYRRSHKTAITQAQRIAEIKDQTVKLSSQIPDTTTPANLRSGVSTLFVNGDLSAQGQLTLNSGNSHAQLSPSNLTSNQNYVLPNSSGTICLSSNNCGFASAGQVAALVQNNFASITGLQGTAGQIIVTGTTGQLKLSLAQAISPAASPQFNSISLANRGSQAGATICDTSNNCRFASADTSLSQGGNSFGSSISLGTLDAQAVNVLAGGNTVANFSASGQASFQNTSDSTTALQVLDASATPLFSVSTVDRSVSLGSGAIAPTVLILGNTSNALDPVGSAGAMYYNTAISKFRCYEAGVWKNCIGASGGGSGDLNQGGNNFGSAISLGALDAYGVNLLASNSVVASFSNSGQALFKNSADSATAFQVQNATGVPLFNVDTASSRISLGASSASPTLLVLGNSNVAPDPAGIPGSIYYNASLGTMRCYQGSAWANCGGAGDVKNGGNSYGADMTIGTLDNKPLYLITNGQTVASFSGEGQVTFSNKVDSQFGFIIYNSFNQPALIVDTMSGNLAVVGGINSGFTKSILRFSNGGYLTTPNSAANTITGSIDIQARILKADLNAASVPIIKKDNSPNSYYFGLNNGKLIFTYSTDGVSVKGSASTVAINNGAIWVRVIFNTSTGEIKYSTATDSINPPPNALYWTQLGSVITTTPGLINGASGAVKVAGSSSPDAAGLNLGRVRVLNGIGGTPVLDVNPSLAVLPSWTAATGEVWTAVGGVKQSGTSSVFGGSVLVSSDGYTNWSGNNMLVVNSPTKSDINAQVLVATGASTNKGLVVQGSTSQTADLLQLQDSKGTAMSGVAATGGFYTNGVSTNFNGLSSPTDICVTYCGLLVGQGGLIAPGLYYYTVTSVNANGVESVPIAYHTESVPFVGYGVAIGWLSVPGASSYRIYRSTNKSFPSPSFLATVDGSITTWLDKASATSAGAPPTSTAGSSFNLQGWDGQSSSLLQIQDITGQNLTTIGANGALSITGGTTVGQKAEAVNLPGAQSAKVTTPDASANQITGDIDIRIKASLKSWDGGGITNQTLLAKQGANAASTSYLFLTDLLGQLSFGISNGSATQTVSSPATGIADGATKWVRVTRQASSGDVTFYTSDDGQTWSQLGAPQSLLPGSINNSNVPVVLGTNYFNDAVLTGKVYSAQILNGINGSVAVSLSPSSAASLAATSWVSPTGETWSLTAPATLVPASSQITVSSGNTSSQGIIVQGVAGQSADLQQWQGSTGIVLASVNAAGVGSFANLLQNGSQVCDTTNNCNFASNNSGTYTQNGIIYFDGTGLASTTAGSSGQCLTATLSAPTWAACGAGGGSGTGDINQGGNIFGQDVTIGAADNNGVKLLVNNTAVARFSASGQAVLQNVSNSTTAFQVQNAAAVSLFMVDSTNSVIYIGNPIPDAVATLLVLDNKNTAGDPANGADGAMYYNSSLKKFRCYQDGSWQDCIYSPILANKKADQSVAGTSYVSLTDLTLPLLGSQSYRLSCSLILSVPTGTGMYISSSAPASTQYTATYGKTGDQAAGDNYATSTTLNDPSPSAIARISSQTGNRFVLNFNAVITDTLAAGNWQIVARSADASAVTVYRGSTCNLNLLNMN